MKTKSLFLFSLFAALAIVSSCEKESVVTPPDKTEPQDTIVTTIDTITCSSSIVILPVVGGDTIVQIFAKENWKAEYNSPWINVTPQESNGTRNVTITVQPGEVDSTTISFCSKNDTTIVLIIRKGYRLPIIKTISPTNITTSSALIRCELISNGGDTSTVYGICWGTHSNLNIENDSIVKGDSQTLSNLSSNQIYYVKAFAKNEQGVAYGETLNFKTLDLGISISATNKIQFAHGNLQYQPSTNIWRFANNQYEYIGLENENKNNAVYTGWIDLFRWRRHDVEVGNNTYQSVFYDWGANNISNAQGSWRTLSNEEWTYILEKRTNYRTRYGLGKIGDVRGLIILPDHWFLPENLDFIPGGDGSTNYEQNSYTIDEWEKMEKAGAVFLPAAGRLNKSVYYMDSDYKGYYWTSSFWGGGTVIEERAYSLEFKMHETFSKIYLISDCIVSLESSVRLAQDMQIL